MTYNEIYRNFVENSCFTRPGLEHWHTQVLSHRFITYKYIYIYIYIYVCMYVSIYLSKYLNYIYDIYMIYIYIYDRDIFDISDIIHLYIYIYIYIYLYIYYIYMYYIYHMYVYIIYSPN